MDRVEITPGRCAGTAVIKGTRIPVAVVLDQLATGESWDFILKGYPELTREDIQGAIKFAREFIEHTELVPSITDK
jgi:uncharacterized protein (DUF433 family)